jgi:hypothetical protein
VWYDNDCASHVLSTSKLPVSHIIAFTDAGFGQHLGKNGGLVRVEDHDKPPEVFKEEISVISFPLENPLTSSNCEQKSSTRLSRSRNEGR